jgi:hypothetical protein
MAKNGENGENRIAPLARLWLHLRAFNELRNGDFENGPGNF